MKQKIVEPIILPGSHGPKIAFADGSWQKPRQPGSQGRILWPKDWSTKTKLAHSGFSGFDKSLVEPINMTVAFSTPTVEDLRNNFGHIDQAIEGKIYGRVSNNNERTAGHLIANLYGTGNAILFSSGMASISNTFDAVLRSGDNIISDFGLYGCTHSLVTKGLRANGVTITLLDLRDPSQIRKHINHSTRAIYFETPTNPSLHLIDISAVASEVKKCGYPVPIIVDNTFQTVMGQNPIDFGAHIVVGSLTKAYAGHGVVFAGMAAASGPFIEHLFFEQRKDGGATLGPFEAWMVSLGARTLYLRFDDMQKNAIKVAKMLCDRDDVLKVSFPLFDPAYRHLHRTGQMTGPGHMILLTLKGGVEAAEKLVRHTKIFEHAVSLGNTASQMIVPWGSTHFFLTDEQKKAAGILPGDVRLSIGIEDEKDLIRDLTQALDKIRRKSA